MTTGDSPETEPADPPSSDPSTIRREQALARQRRYREQHADDVRESTARYRNANREALRAAARERYAQNRDKALSYAREHAAERAAYVAGWQKRNAARLAEYRRLRREIAAELPAVLALCSAEIVADLEDACQRYVAGAADHTEARQHLAGHQPEYNIPKTPLPPPPAIVPSPEFHVDANVQARARASANPSGGRRRVPLDAAAVALVRRLRGEGKGWRAVAQGLNDAGFRNKEGGAWTVGAACNAFGEVLKQEQPATTDVA